MLTPSQSNLKEQAKANGFSVFSKLPKYKDKLQLGVHEIPLPCLYFLNRPQKHVHVYVRLTHSLPLTCFHVYSTAIIMGMVYSNSS